VVAVEAAVLVLSAQMQVHHLEQTLVVVGVQE
jgi:hypothetical protein